MGKKRIIAETGAGQHGVATATVCALFGLQCVVYMGTEDMRRQELNVFRMRLLGAEVRGVESGSRTLKDAINEAMRDWVTNVRDTHYLLGSVLGAHPYPTMVRDFHSVIGREHAALADSKRAEYVAASDAEALDACTRLARTEGIIPALESSHAVAECIKRAPKMKKSDIVIVNVSGRGDKDMGILRESLNL